MNQISKRLEKAVEAAKAWPLDRQEAAAEVLEQMNRLAAALEQMNRLAAAPYKLSDAERADLEEALAEARRGEFASDAEVAAMFAQHGL